MTRYVSVSSIVAALSHYRRQFGFCRRTICDRSGIVTTALGALAIYKHKTNIQRLMAGTENRFGKKKETK